MEQLTVQKPVTIQHLYKNPEELVDQDKVNVILSQPPPVDWIKKHPYIANYLYLPIDKVEWLLRRIFKSYQIEITGQGVAFNGVWVTVRVHYKDILTGEMRYHDGIGATELQTKSGSSPADLANINTGALGMALPIAKTRAIKDACDHFGPAFGSELNKKDTIAYTQDMRLEEVAKTTEEKRMSRLIEHAKDKATLEQLKSHVTANIQKEFDQKWNTLTSGAAQ